MLLLIITIVFAVLLVLIVATLLIPVDISLRLVKEGDLAELRMVVGFLKGALSGRIDFSHDKREFQLQLFGSAIIRRDLAEKAEKEPTDWNKIVVHADELYDAGTDLTVALTKNIAIKRLRTRVGLDDPYQTGMLTGVLYAGSGIAKAFLPDTDIEIEPTFVQEHSFCYGQPDAAHISLHPYSSGDRPSNP